MKMKRWQFLLVSVFIVTVVLMIGTGKYFSLVRQERLEEMRQIQEEKDVYKRQDYCR